MTQLENNTKFAVPVMLYHIIKERRDDVRTFRLEVVEVPWCYSNKW